MKGLGYTIICFLAIFMLTTASVIAVSTPGIREDVSSSLKTASISALSTGGLAPTITERGKISWSIDANGENSGSGTLRVLKPAGGATVRGAYLMAASTGGSSYHITNSDIGLASNAVAFTTEIASSIGSYNYFTDVTSIVKPLIDSASSGITNLDVTEANTYSIDGEVLVVIFNDPNQIHDNTIVLAFGAQKTTGDTFNIGLANPINKSVSGFMLDMSLGISYGYQPAGQYSQIDVNGLRLTTSAGGQDDGQAANGALITAGGIDDTNANPADAFATDGNGARYDDELYNLVSEVKDGDTAITVDTLNPSTDDNIFFAGFFLGSINAVIPNGIDTVLLDPVSATNNLGTQHTVTATVKDANGDSIVGTQVSFSIVSGPNNGMTGTDTTDANGQATFTYTGNILGVDTIEASILDASQSKITSNQVTKEWIKGTSNKCESDITKVKGVVSDVDGPIADKTVTVKCMHGAVEYTETTTTLNDGSYKVEFPKSQCTVDDEVTVSADDSHASSTVTNDCKCIVNLAIVDLTIPEFGVVAGLVALLGAIAIFTFRRK